MPNPFKDFEIEKVVRAANPALLDKYLHNKIDINCEELLTTASKKEYV